MHRPTPLALTSENSKIKNHSSSYWENKESQKRFNLALNEKRNSLENNLKDMNTESWADNNV